MLGRLLANWGAAPAGCLFLLPLWHPVLESPVRRQITDADARTMLQQALSKGYHGIPAEALVAGSIDEVAEQFRGLEELGYTDVIVRHLTNDQSKVLGSLERLKEVRAVLG